MIGRGIVFARAAVVSLALVGAGGAARAERPASAPFSDLQPGATPEAAYAANAYAIVHVGKTDQVNEPGSTWRPVRGLVYRFSIDPDVFLDSVGEADLASNERTHHRAAQSLSLGGTVLACAGLVAALAGFGYDHNVIGIAGLGSLLGGAIAHEMGESMLDHPVLPEDRALQLASRLQPRPAHPPGAAGGSGAAAARSLDAQRRPGVRRRAAGVRPRRRPGPRPAFLAEAASRYWAATIGIAGVGRACSCDSAKASVVLSDSLAR